MVSFNLRHFLTVDDCNMDKCLESSWRLVYCQVSGELGITGFSRRSDFYPKGSGKGGGVDLLTQAIIAAAC